MIDDVRVTSVSAAEPVKPGRDIAALRAHISITVAFLCVLADGWPGLASGAAAAVWRLTRVV
jgi:hypothetical protein